MAFFPYGLIETDHLRERDEKLGAVIKRIGPIRRDIVPDPFEALILSVVNQQISKQAAQTVWNRLCTLLGQVTAERLAGVAPAQLRACGLSDRKVGYLKGIAEAALGRIDFAGLSNLPDREIIDTLSALPGVGVWTAEMFLIFSLCRPDVVSYGDLALRRGMMKLYGLTDLPREKFQIYRGNYSPYGSVASLYLWAFSA
ncbi:HhH-GPD superfamily base excision DNA repair protein [Acididesulfobacillus acetoxydans]|uniref:DNA-3-methyladenine glycosylase II n=1 Tax=Acididesulfobacillus acetoxydans TaxID=1561005 RepID=A0A8S0Y374_9FIRM|nr:DNA-3-methyladenine glycosylase [Acididesulfobacillus acetoxydans]CAA7601735.1 HhH-GPD superfamily base excision DNA repair protein [Acididesulfobacillus acetoxydans]CEJ09046.1 HhH-GPD superbase excision DNA repair protein [Acididesulfobacillus acetoxydans]